MKTLKPLLPLFWILLLSFITIQLEQPISVDAADPDGFSAINAMKHLEIMASEPHPMGTTENRKVKDYILSEFDKLNIPTEIFVGQSKSNWGSQYVQLARTENIIATIKGKSSNKAVMVVGHYDSVVGSPGAADDVHSVACMLSIAELLQTEQQENDIIFLITDGEERGLFGAQAFSEQRDLSKIGVVLNYESRGNSGGSLSFEWSDGNAWLVDQLRQAAKRPLANSMSFEIYKTLPNDTDFTYFKEAGLSGINHAFIDGFSYYHNPDDTPENININSVQHTGENMLRLTKHFANTDLTITKTKNASFFNLLSFLVIYPSSWDIVLLIAVLLFLVFTIIAAFRSSTITGKSYILGIVGVLGVIAISAALCFGLSKLLFAFYPQYEVFYAGQFYNHKWYLITCLGITILITALLSRRFKSPSFIMGLKAAVISILGLLCIVIYWFMPTASYFMLFPSLFIAGAFNFEIKNDVRDIVNSSNYLYSIIPFAIWFPTIITFFLAFSIAGLPLPAIIIGIICLASFVLFDQLWLHSKALQYIGLATIVLSFAVGHFTSAPTESKPLPSSLFYHYNSITKQAKWATNDERLNIGNEELLEGATDSEIFLPNARKRWNVNTDVQPHIDEVEIIKDSIDTNSFVMVSKDDIYRTRLYLKDPSNIEQVFVNDQEVLEGPATSKLLTITTYGMSSDTLRIRLLKKDNSKSQTIAIQNIFMSLPVNDVIPNSALRRDGNSSIVQQVEL